MTALFTRRRKAWVEVAKLTAMAAEIARQLDPAISAYESANEDYQIELALQEMGRHPRVIEIDLAPGPDTKFEHIQETA